MIEELIKKYQEQKFSSDFAKSSLEALMVNQKLDEILQDLEELKKQLSEAIMINWDGSSYTDETIECKVAEINITKLKNILVGVDTDE